MINWTPKKQNGLVNWAPKVGPEGAPEFAATDIPRAFVGTAYTVTLSATGVVPITYALTSGQLPAGLSLSPDGVISGTPTGSTGTSSVVITATNAAGSTPITLDFDVFEIPSVHSVVLTPSVASVRVGETVDLQATVLDQFGDSVRDMAGTALASPGSVASAVTVGLTDAAGHAVVRVTGVTGGLVSIVAKFGDFISEPTTVTVSVPVVALLAGAAFGSAVAAANLGVSVVKGVQIRLHSKAGVPRGAISDVQIRWWDSDVTVAPRYVGTGVIDGGGWIKVDLDAVTQLPVGGMGRIDLFKPGASYVEDMHFASRLPVVDLRSAQ